MDFVRGPDRLASLERDQFSNDEIAEGERKNESRDRGHDRAERDITKNVEAFNLIAQEMEVIHHGATASGACRFANASRTRSIRAVRLPLTRIKSPGTAFSPSNSAAFSGESTALLFSKPAFPAACAMAAPFGPTAIN